MNDRRDNLEHRITGSMAVRVIDRAELVDVETEERERCLTAARGCAGKLEVKLTAVREPRQGIGARLRYKLGSQHLGPVAALDEVVRHRLKPAWPDLRSEHDR